MIKITFTQICPRVEPHMFAQMAAFLIHEHGVCIISSDVNKVRLVQGQSQGHGHLPQGRG